MLPHSDLSLAHSDSELIEALAWFGARVKLLNLRIERDFQASSRRTNAPAKLAAAQLALDQWRERLTVSGLEEVVKEDYAKERERVPR